MIVMALYPMCRAFAKVKARLDLGEPHVIRPHGDHVDAPKLAPARVQTSLVLPRRRLRPGYDAGDVRILARRRGCRRRCLEALHRLPALVLLLLLFLPGALTRPFVLRRS